MNKGLIKRNDCSYKKIMGVSKLSAIFFFFKSELFLQGHLIQSVTDYFSSCSSFRATDCFTLFIEEK